MPVKEGVKYSCSACIKGHRSSSCEHTGRELFEIQKKGRPALNCKVCKAKRAKCICEKGSTTSEPLQEEPVAKRQKGRNSKAHLAIERAKAKGAVICTCGEKGSCVCPPGKGPCCQTASKVASSSAVSLEDICCLPPPVPLQTLPNIFVDPTTPQTGPTFHHFTPSHLIPVQVPDYIEVPSVGKEVPQQSSCCQSKDRPLAVDPPLSLFANPALPSEGPVFHNFPPSSPPAYHQQPDEAVFSFSLNDLSQAACCAGPCRPEPSSLDPLLAELFSGYSSAQSAGSTTLSAGSEAALSALVASQTPSGCSCSSGKVDAAPLAAGVEACTTCGPACGCGSECRCGKMSSLQFPLDYDVDALLKELLGSSASTLVEEKTATEAPASSCCCAK